MTIYFWYRTFELVKDIQLKLGSLPTAAGRYRRHYRFIELISKSYSLYIIQNSWCALVYDFMLSGRDHIGRSYFIFKVIFFSYLQDRSTKPFRSSVHLPVSDPSDFNLRAPCVQLMPVIMLPLKWVLYWTIHCPPPNSLWKDITGRTKSPAG